MLNCPILIDFLKSLVYNYIVTKKSMNLIEKFKKDLNLLQSAAKREIYLDVKNPKLYKKLRRYYENEGLTKFTGDIYEDYEIIIDNLAEDLTEVNQWK